MQPRNNPTEFTVKDFKTIIDSLESIDFTGNLKYKSVIDWYVRILQESFMDLDSDWREQVAWDYYRILRRLNRNCNISNQFQKQVRDSISRILSHNSFPQLSSFEEMRKYLEEDDDEWSWLRLNFFSKWLEWDNIWNDERKKLWKMVLLKPKFNTFMLEEPDLKLILRFFDSLEDDNRYKFEFTGILRRHQTFRKIDKVESQRMLMWFERYTKQHHSYSWPDSIWKLWARLGPLAARY